MEAFFIIDANTFLYKAYYAYSGMSDSKGRPTAAIFGFTKLLMKLINEKRPDYIAIVFEMPAPAMRERADFKFKAKHPMMPPDLKEQLPDIKEIVKSFRIPLLESEQYESNDIIASLTKAARWQQLEIYIVASDKDIFQLVQENVKIINPNQEGVVFDKQKIEELYGVRPGLMPDLLALAGDKSNNIPGIEGIGQKRAKELLAEFGRAEEVARHLDLGPEKVKMVAFGKRIATLDASVPIKFSIENFRLKTPDIKKLTSMLMEYELVDLCSDLKTHHPQPDVHYKAILREEELAQLVQLVKSKTEFAIDTETTSVEPMEAELVGISISTQPKEGFYVPVGHRYAGAPKQLSKEVIISHLSDILKDPAKKKIGQNIKYDYIVLKNFGLELGGISFDTMIASFLINPGVGGNNLDDMALKYLDYKTITFGDLMGGGPLRVTMREISIQKVTEYACEDSDITLRLKNYLEPQLAQRDLQRLFTKIEMPLVPILANIEISGVLIDRNLMEEISDRLSKMCKDIENQIHILAGEEFNIGSHKQLSSILFEKLKIPVIKKTRTGFSTKDNVMERLAGKYPIVEKILEYRRLSTIKSTHIDGLIALINKDTQRVHTNFNQTVTATGRLTSSRPNLQNVPAYSEIAKDLRRAFIAPEGFCLLSSDYSQIELRILAHLSKDKTLIEAFNKGFDIHTETASRVFGVSKDKVTADMRKKAKAVIFGVIYGITEAGLTQQLGINRDEAIRLIRAILDKYPDVKTFIQRCINGARKDGFVTTLSGRRRYLPQIKSTNLTLMAQAEREAVNTPIQGSAADLIKLAMIDIDKRIREQNLNSYMILQIHDELLLEVLKEELDTTAKLVKESMENAINLSVPVVVNMHTGPNWQDMSEYTPS